MLRFCLCLMVTSVDNTKKTENLVIDLHSLSTPVTQTGKLWHVATFFFILSGCKGKKITTWH